MNTFWRNDQPIMHIFHFFLCIFYKAQLDINDPGYHGNQMSFWTFKACFAVWGSYLLHTQRLRKIPDVACRTPIWPGRVAQSVTCLATDACLTADPEVASSIPVRSHTFVEIDHEMISTVILLPSADLFKKGCCQLQAKVCARITG